jgi:nucleoside-diphosphate-sugar epimerase
VRVFVAGSTGAIGRFLVPQLLEAGDEVIALVRDPARGGAIRSLGATLAVADPLDAPALTSAVVEAKPEVVIHELTAIAGAGDFKKLDQDFALTNRFRTETTDVLIAASRAAGARRFIAQSFCGWPFAREGGPVKTEDDPLDPDPPPSFRRTLAAIRHLETAVRSAAGVEAIALRYGMFYGPGTSIARDGMVGALARRRRIPIVGSGAGVWSFVHVADAARATVAAVSRGGPGLYNVVDDEPAPVAAWLPELARAVGGKPPRRVPAWLGRLAIGEGGVSMMTKVRGGSNAKARRELGWEPSYPSWRKGFFEGLA